MKILIRSVETGLYLADGNRWVKNPPEARDFKHAALAVTYASQENLTGVQVTYAFEDERYNVYIPLTGDRPQTRMA